MQRMHIAFYHLLSFHINNQYAVRFPLTNHCPRSAIYYITCTLVSFFQLTSTPTSSALYIFANSWKNLKAQE